MSTHDEHYRFRDALTDQLIVDVMGPIRGPQEILSDLPVNTYLMGVIFPRRSRPEDAAVDTAESDGDLRTTVSDVDEQPDTGVSMANRQSPSSLGLTFTVDPIRCSRIRATAYAAVYQPIDEAGNPTEAVMDVARSTDESSVRWRRATVAGTPQHIDVTEPAVCVLPLATGLELRAHVRRADPATNTVTITVTLVNLHEVKGGGLRDPWCFFQCGLRIETVGDTPGIVEQPDPVQADGERLLARMLYRHAPTFAAGHGCAAEWTTPAADLTSPDVDTPRTVRAVYSSITPTFDVLVSESNTDIDTDGLHMIDLAGGDTDRIVATLRRLVDGYQRWVADRETEAAVLHGTRYATVAAGQVRQCRQAHDRMSAGVDLLEQNPDVMRAFRLANEAMAVQRHRTTLMRDPSTTAGMDAEVWYPFQLGFILLCLDGLADPDHPDRGIADLLWFPTGGGKTEAYLGIVAMTVFLRRIRCGPAGGGVTVLMRYTLRLLTLQQFERAATLMCAMDVIRRREHDLGGEEISVGMWVGSTATPNSLQKAEHGLRELRDGKKLHEENPVQLRRCPWCGTDIDEYNYLVDRGTYRMVVACPDNTCTFHHGIPVHLVDESIYRHRPTLVIATVDKFAQIAWKDEPAALFNRAGAPDGTPPPELVIQDELHLISGPLGTLVGIYETALDIASQRPKVVASTATIRRAQEQGKALFDRDVRQFPPSGLDARDSWFAVEASADRKASRRYLGLFAPNTSQATLLVRAYAALLHHATSIDGNDDIRDAYWTLIGYFNSLRLLGAAELQVNDDVAIRLKLLAGDDTPRNIDMIELTSRADASDIPVHLRQLDIRYPRADAVDVVLATNMISVGVDVDRLGLMAVTGQPQTTAEYIQATSRVGRRHPGLVVVLYNAARSRDRSHYENFRSYHSALYRQVESTSVTPFSSRARDRALHAALVGAVRLTVPTARANKDAVRVASYLTEVRDLAARIVERVQSIFPEEAAAARDELDNIIDRWNEMAVDSDGTLQYQRRRPPGDTRRRPDCSALLRDYGDDDLPGSFSTMNSLRDVDVETDLREARR